jgi:hypothetical protein
MCVLLLDHRGPSVETELFFRAPPWMSCASPPELYSGPEASDLRNWGRPKPEPTLHISETPCPNEPLLSTTTSVRVKERKKEAASRLERRHRSTVESGQASTFPSIALFSRRLALHAARFHACNKKAVARHPVCSRLLFVPVPFFLPVPQCPPHVCLAQSPSGHSTCPTKRGAHYSRMARG